MLNGFYLHKTRFVSFLKHIFSFSNLDRLDFLHVVVKPTRGTNLTQRSELWRWSRVKEADKQKEKKNLWIATTNEWLLFQLYFNDRAKTSGTSNIFLKIAQGDLKKFKLFYQTGIFCQFLHLIWKKSHQRVIFLIFKNGFFSVETNALLFSPQVLQVKMFKSTESFEVMKTVSQLSIYFKTRESLINFLNN